MTSTLEIKLADYRAKCIYIPYIVVDGTKFYAYVSVDMNTCIITDVQFHTDKPTSKVTSATCQAIDNWMRANNMSQYELYEE